MNLNSGPKKAPCAKFELDQVIILKISSFFVFSTQKMTWTNWTQKVAMAKSYYNDY